MELRRGEYLISDDKSLADVKYIREKLDTTYWAKGRSREAVRKTLETSSWLFLFHHDQPAGFCRLVSDYASFAWVADVFVDQAHRGRGVGKWMLASLLQQPAADVEKILLGTKDAHGLYEKYGFGRREMMIKYVRRERPSWSLPGAAGE